MTTPLKRCSKCGKDFPTTPEFFHRDRGRLTAGCKACNSAKTLAYRVANPEKVKASNHNHYLRNSERVKANVAAYRAADPDRTRRMHQDYYQRNSERVRAVVKAYRLANPDVIRERKRDYFIRNKAKIVARSRIRYQTDETARRAKRAYSRANAHRWRISRNAVTRNYRARKRNAPGFHTADDVRRQYEKQGGTCYWCSISVGEDYHVDHLRPLNRNGTNWADNIVISCPTCNTSRGDKLECEWTDRPR